MLHNIFKFLIFVVLELGFGFKVYGREHVPKKGGFILASNHLSYLDPMVVGTASPRTDLNYMARHDLFRNPWFGWLIYKVHAFPVKRDTADFKALREAIRRVKKQEGLLLFPEGTRQTSGKLGEPEPGVGFLAAKIQAPIIPVRIKGTDKAWPKGARFLRPAKIEVAFGQQILVNSKMSYEEVAEKIMSGIHNLA